MTRGARARILFEMSAERPLLISPPAYASEVSGVHRLDRLEGAPEVEPPLRPTLRVIEPPGRTPPAPGLGELIPTDLGAPELYLNRELTYLNFCWRVLHEAEDDRIPLLERLRFLAIVSSNIVEFFQNRIGGLKQQVGAQLHSVTADGRTPQQQIDQCLELVNSLERRKNEVLDRVVSELRAVGVWLAPYRELDPKEQTWVREHYLRNIFPLVTPQAMDPAHPFPFV